MRDIRWRQVREGPEGRQERLLGTLDEMATVERVARNYDGTPSPIWLLLQLWKSAPGRGLPLTDDLEDDEITPTTLSRCVSFVDVETDDPMNFVLRKHAALSVAAPHFSDQSNRRLSEHPVKMNRHSVAMEYATCVKERLPFYHEISQTVFGATRCYRRFMLPSCDVSGRVNRIYYAIRPIRIVGAST